MKFKPIALFLLVFALVGNAFADGSDDAKMSPSLEGKKLSFHDKSWYMGEKLVDPEVAFNAMKSNEESASAYSTAMGFYYPGMVLAYAGGAALGYGVVTWIWGENSDLGMYLTLGGAGVIGISLLLTKIADGYMHDAIDLYNKGIGISETSLRLKLVPTEQGGIAVALAF